MRVAMVYKCECGNPGCTRTFETTPEEYRRLGSTDIVVVVKGCCTAILDHTGELLQETGHYRVYSRVRPE